MIETPEQVAEAMHDAYERLAPEHGYETREASRKPWDSLPENHRALMTAAVAEAIADLRPAEALRNALRKLTRVQPDAPVLVESETRKVVIADLIRDIGYDDPVIAELKIMVVD